MNLTIFKRAIIAVLMFSLLCGTTALAKTEWNLVNNPNGKKTSLKVKNKNWSYWEISEKTPLKFKVTGPTRIRLLTRAVIPDKQKETLYGIIVTSNGQNRNFIGRASEVAKDVKHTRDNSLQIAQSRNLYFAVPAGEHEFAFSLPKNTKQPVFVRAFTEGEKKPAPNYVAFLPRKFSEEVPIIVNEQEYIYYRASSDKPIEIEVIGPTRIRALSRLEFDHSMRGEKSYRIQVKENEKILVTKPFTSQVSGVAAYRSKNDMIIGKGDAFYIDVPAGKHRYTILTPDAGFSVLFRFYIPQSDLGLELKSKSSNNTLFPMNKNKVAG